MFVFFLHLYGTMMRCTHDIAAYTRRVREFKGARAHTTHTHTRTDIVCARSRRTIFGRRWRRRAVV